MIELIEAFETLASKNKRGSILYESLYQTHRVFFCLQIILTDVDGNYLLPPEVAGVECLAAGVVVGAFSQDREAALILWPC